MGAIFDKKFYTGGKTYTHSKYLEIHTYLQHDNTFSYVFLMYDDKSRLFAFRHSRTSHPDEVRAYQAACDLLEVAVLSEVQ